MQRCDILNQLASAGLLYDGAVNAFAYHQIHRLPILCGIVFHNKAGDIAQRDIQIVFFCDEADLLPWYITVITELEYPSRYLQRFQNTEGS